MALTHWSSDIDDRDAVGTGVRRSLGVGTDPGDQRFPNRAGAAA